MEISKYLRNHSRTISSKQQLIISALAKALEIIPRQICDNAGLDATDILNKLRMRHAQGDTWSGVDVDGEGAADNMKRFVWEPSVVKTNAVSSAVEAACLILSVDETVRNPQSEVRDKYPPRWRVADEKAQEAGPQMPRGAAQRAMRGRGRGMPRR